MWRIIDFPSFLLNQAIEQVLEVFLVFYKIYVHKSSVSGCESVHIDLRTFMVIWNEFSKSENLVYSAFLVVGGAGPPGPPWIRP